MISETKNVLFLKAENKSFKKGVDTIEYMNATILDVNNVAWDMTVANEIKTKVDEIDPRTDCSIVIDLYKTKFEGKEQIKMRMLDIEVM